MKYVKIVLLILVIVLFPTHYYICDYFMKDFTNEMFMMYYNGIKHLLLLLILISVCITYSSFTTRILYEIIIGIVSSDVYGRFMYGDSEFHVSDLWVIVMPLICDFLVYYCKNSKQFKNG